MNTVGASSTSALRAAARPIAHRIGAANRKVLVRGADTFSERGWDRLEQVLRTDDPTDELGAA